jgi:hypothetical protein
MLTGNSAPGDKKNLVDPIPMPEGQLITCSFFE